MTELRRILIRRRRAAAELFGVLVLVALAGAALTAWTLAEFREQVAAGRMTAGHVAAGWLLAMHRSTQETDWRAIVAGGGAVVSPASLAAAGHSAPGLPATQRGMTMVLGVIADGTPDAVPMAFLVLEPATVVATAGIHKGLIEAGVTGVEFATGPAGAMAAHRPAIEALVGTLAPGAFYVTADTLALEPAVLYRRPQPGRPRLNRMETDLDLDRHDVAGAASLLAGTIDHLDPAIDPDDATTWPGVRMLSTAVTSTAGAIADPASLLPGTLTVDRTALSIEPGAAMLEASASATFAAFDGASVEAAAGLRVTSDLLVGSLVTRQSLRSAAANIAGGLQAATLEAAALRAQGTTIAGATHVAGAIATPSAAAATVSGAPVVDTGTVTATGGVYGPSLTITGALTTSSCDGC